MAGKIFVSYRRDDAAGDARGIRDALAANFGPTDVFMDVDNLLAGQRFDRELSDALDSCDVLIAVMGQRWMDLLTARTEGGERDYVREEIAAALRRAMIVIPVRVGLEGRMPPLPRGRDLPEDIRDLVLHQKHDVAHETFGRDMRDLVSAIEGTRKRVAEAEQRRPPFNLSRVAPPQQSGSGGPPKGQEGDPRGYDLGNYMPAPGQQGPAQPHPAHLWPEQQGPSPFAAPQGYGEADADYDEILAEEEEPRRGRRGLVIVAVLVGVIGLGGVMANTYKTFVASPVGRAPLVKASEDDPSKVKPVTPAGKEPDSNAPRKVRISPITSGDQAKLAKAPGGSAPPVVAVPGVTLDSVGPPPSAARVQLPPPVLPATRTAPRAGEGPAPKVPVPKAAPIGAAAPTTTGPGGYVAVLSSQKSRMAALKYFADMQSKYEDVLGNAMPDVQEANLGDKGVWYRPVVGPPGSRDAAAGICSRLKSAGYSGCWVTAY